MTTKSMEVFNSTITKEEINALPVESFSGRIIVIQTEADADKAVAYLFRYPLVGFDTETRPSFKKGQYNKVALMQISNFMLYCQFWKNPYLWQKPQSSTTLT